MRISDWSSDVCSSDLQPEHAVGDRAAHQRGHVGVVRTQPALQRLGAQVGLERGFDLQLLEVELAAGDGRVQRYFVLVAQPVAGEPRSEARRVGKAWVSQWSYRGSPSQ